MDIDFVEREDEFLQYCPSSDNSDEAFLIDAVESDDITLVDQERTESAAKETIEIIQQPPSEVRTRTLKDSRTFKCIVKVPLLDVVDPKTASYPLVHIRLCIAHDRHGKNTSYAASHILSGNDGVPVNANGYALFDNLSVSEASTKHQNKEFCLQVSCGHLVAYSAPFFAYSHKKVLVRRRNVQLRTASCPYGHALGGERMHIIGTPFIKSNQFTIRFRIIEDFSYGASSNEAIFGDSLIVFAQNIEHFSDSVVFFDSPRCPVDVPPGSDVKAVIEVSNDGRFFSNSLDFVYEGTVERKRLALRSRI